MALCVVKSVGFALYPLIGAIYNYKTIFRLFTFVQKGGICEKKRMLLTLFQISSIMCLVRTHTIFM